MIVVGPLHYFILKCVHILKWLEFGITKLFWRQAEAYIRYHFEKIGVVFFVVSPEDKINEELLWTEKERNRVLRKSKYEKLIFIHVKSRYFFVQLCNSGMMAFGEKFTEGEVHIEPCDHTEFARRFAVNNMYLLYYHKYNRFLNYLDLILVNYQTRAKAREVAVGHYDLGNDLFESFLDPWMQYTCAYWKNADNLNDAQLRKLELIAQKLELKPGMKVLDLGCGWGTLCKYLAEHHGVHCVGVNIANEGIAYGRKVCKGLPVEFLLQDYRRTYGQFDRVVSIGLLEHVGKYNYREFFQVAHRCLKDDGIFLYHSICNNNSTSTGLPRSEPWLHTYVFPNGQIPMTKDIILHSEDLFVMEDWHNFGYDYSLTLEAWKENFMKEWPNLAPKYGEKFRRMWMHYMSIFSGVFQARKFHVYQVVFTKTGYPGGYQAPR